MDGLESSDSVAKVWLVSGCSSGFGRMLVLAILARGDNVIATAHRLSDLDYINGVDGAKALQLDVPSSEDIFSTKAAEAINTFGHVDVLVNNAGYGSSGVWEEVK
jgi:NAD(P)-dependent dehydrogenase (short-subunit alcohol dehydrogenase family)